MKSIVRSLVAASVCGLLALVIPATYAQTKPGAPPAPGAPKKAHRPGMLDVMTKMLKLTPAQVAQAKVVMKTRSDKHKSIDDALLTAKDRRDQLKAVDGATMMQLNAILTPAQRTQYMQFQAAQKAAQAKKAAPKP